MHRPAIALLAGANYVERSWTPQGVGALAQVNFLGPYALTRQLEGVLAASAARVVRPCCGVLRGALPQPAARAAPPLPAPHAVPSLPASHACSPSHTLSHKLALPWPPAGRSTSRR